MKISFFIRVMCCVYLFSLLLHFESAQAAEKISRSQYIAMYKDDAIKDMQRTGVPASITMAQACLESSNGNSALAKDANNHFGVKCADWKGETYTMDDDKKDECFRKYNSVIDSYDDHSNFLKTRSRYASLFQLDIKDYKGWAHGLKKAGYATDPSYANRLITIIEENNLQFLDEGKDFMPIADASPQPVIQKPGHSTSGVQMVPGGEITIYADRKVMKNNGVEYVLAREGETLKSISRELQLGSWQLPKYNETRNGARLREGQIVYIKPKKKKGRDKFYVVQQGDDLVGISNAQGIKSRFILKYNDLASADVVKVGMKLKLSN